MTTNRNKRGELTVAALLDGMRDQVAWWDGDLRREVQLAVVKGSGLRLTAVAGDRRINVDREPGLGATTSGLVAGGVILWFGDDIKAARAEFRRRARHA